MSFWYRLLRKNNHSTVKMNHFHTNLIQSNGFTAMLQGNTSFPQGLFWFWSRLTCSRFYNSSHFVRTISRIFRNCSVSNVSKIKQKTNPNLACQEFRLQFLWFTQIHTHLKDNEEFAYLKKKYLNTCELFDINKMSGEKRDKLPKCRSFNMKAPIKIWFLHH